MLSSFHQSPSSHTFRSQRGRDAVRHPAIQFNKGFQQGGVRKVKYGSVGFNREDEGDEGDLQEDGEWEDEGEGDLLRTSMSSWSSSSLLCPSSSLISASSW
jgi:hypothetical protein